MTPPDLFRYAAVLVQACAEVLTLIPTQSLALRDLTGDAHLAGRAAVPTTTAQPHYEHTDPAFRHVHPLQEEPARPHSPPHEAPVALQSAREDDGMRTAETSPVSPELAGGPLGYRDRKAPAWPGRGADAPAEPPASAAGVWGVSALLTST